MEYFKEIIMIFRIETKNHECITAITKILPRIDRLVQITEEKPQTLDLGFTLDDLMKGNVKITLTKEITNGTTTHTEDRD